MSAKKLLRTYSIGNDRYQTALYHLKDDLGETKNLAVTHSEKTQSLSQLLNKWESETTQTAASLPNRRTFW